MSDDSRLARFEAAVLVHLDAAYGFARWLTGDEVLAEDAVQEACLKALRTFETRTGPSAKAWFIAVVRNSCLDALRGRRRHVGEESFDEEAHTQAASASIEAPEAVAMRASDARWVRAEIARLPVEFREVIVLRELEELSYKEISAIVRIPIGTVMSRLSRGRDLLADRIRAEAKRRLR
ncbi:MAG: sigma-70 family RNA polymerase sigma factor [Burkholderiales bacterium]